MWCELVQNGRLENSRARESSSVVLFVTQNLPVMEVCASINCTNYGGPMEGHIKLTSNFMENFTTFPQSWETLRQISCLRLSSRVAKFYGNIPVCDFTPVAQKGHQRLKYWRQYSWKISRLSPVAKFDVKFHICDRIFSPKSRNLSWRQISCLRLFPKSLNLTSNFMSATSPHGPEGTQRLKYWRQYS